MKRGCGRRWRKWGIAGWEWTEIDPTYGDTADFCQRYGYDLPHCANTIIVASKRGPAAFCAGIVRGCDRLDVNRRVRGLIGVSRASFASAEETREVTGMMTGGVTALALPPGLPIYTDMRPLEMDYIILGAGSRSSKLKMAPGSWGNCRVWSSSRGCRFRRGDGHRFPKAFNASW